MNLVQLVKYITNVAKEHPLVKTVIEGDIYQLNSLEVKYGVFCITQPMNNVMKEDNIMKYTFTIFYADRLVENESNKLVIQTDGINTIHEIFNYIKTNAQTADITIPITFTTFTEKFVDKCAGAYATVTVEVDDETGNCDFYYENLVYEPIPGTSHTTALDNYYTKVEVDDLLANKADKATTLAGYGIPDTPLDNKIYGRKNGDWEEIDSISIISITYTALKNLRDNVQLVPGQSYRITDYITTTTQTNTQSAGNVFDIIVTSLDENTLSENVSVIKRDGDTYFSSKNANLESWELKYCLDNDTNRFAWADSVNGKGVIYYMKDENNNELPYDFKNIQFKKSNVFLYTFGGATDNSLVAICSNNKINPYILSNKQTLNNITFGTNCRSNTFGNDCRSNTFSDDCYQNTFGDGCYSNTFGYTCYSNTFGDYCYSNTFGGDCYSNTFGYFCNYNTFSDDCYSNTFGDDCYSNTFGYFCNYNTFGNSCRSNTFGNSCYSNTFGNNCRYNTFGNNCFSNTFGDDCYSNNFYHGSNGTTKKNYIKYIVLEDGVSNNNFYSNLTTSYRFYLQRIRIKGLEHTTPTDTIITLPTTNTDYEWLVAKDSSGIVQQYCPENLVDAPLDNILYGRKNGDWEEIDTSGFITDAYTKTEVDIKFENTRTYKIENVLVSTWSDSTSYVAYPFEAMINITNLKETDSVEVIYNIIDAGSANYAPGGELYEGYIKIFAKVNTEITIPTLVVTKIDL